METTNKVFLYGASGHAKVVMDIAKLVYIDVPCLIDDDLSINTLTGVQVVHSADGLSPIIVTVGDCSKRREIVRKLGKKDFLTIIHPTVIKSESVRLGYGTVVMAGVILNPNVNIGNHCIINTGASLDHDVRVEDYVHIAPHCTLCGDVEVGEETWLGAGSTVIQGIHIGKKCYIGAGSVVVKDIPDSSLCYGNPARVIKKMDKISDE